MMVNDFNQTIHSPILSFASSPCELLVDEVRRNTEGFGHVSQRERSITLEKLRVGEDSHLPDVETIVLLNNNQSGLHGHHLRLNFFFLVESAFFNISPHPKGFMHRMAKTAKMYFFCHDASTAKSASPDGDICPF